MFFPGGARAAPHPPDTFALGRVAELPYNLGKRRFFPASGDPCESEPQLLLFRRPAGRRDPYLPPYRGQKRETPDPAPLLSPEGRREGGRIRALHRIVRKVVRKKTLISRSPT